MTSEKVILIFSGMFLWWIVAVVMKRNLVARLGDTKIAGSADLSVGSANFDRQVAPSLPCHNTTSVRNNLTSHS